MSDADTPIANPETLWIVEVTAPLPSARVQIVVAEASARLKLPPEKLTALLDNRIGPVTKPLPRASAERVAEVLDVAGVDVQLKPSSPGTAPQTTQPAEAKPAQVDVPASQPSATVSPEPAIPTPGPTPTSTGDSPAATTSDVEVDTSANQASEIASPASSVSEPTAVPTPSAATWKPPLLPTKAEKESRVDASDTATSAAVEPEAQRDETAEQSPELHAPKESSVREATGDGSGEQTVAFEAASPATATASPDPSAVSTEPQRFASPNEPERVDEELGRSDSVAAAASVSGVTAPPTSMNPPFEPDEPIEATQISEPEPVHSMETDSSLDEQGADEQGKEQEPAAPTADLSGEVKGAPLFASQNLEQFEVPSHGVAETPEADTGVSGPNPPTASASGQQDPWARLDQEDDVEDLGQWNVPSKKAFQPNAAEKAPAPVPDEVTPAGGPEAAKASSLPVDTASASRTPSSGPASPSPRETPDAVPAAPSAAEAQAHPMFSTDDLGAQDDDAFAANEETFFSGGMRDPFKEAEERERAIRRGILLTALVVATGVLIYLQRGLI